MISDPPALGEVAAALWRNGLPSVEEDLARAGGPVADALRRALARAAHLLARAESERELSDALVLRLTGVPELASMVESFRATSPGPGLRSRWPMPDQPAPGLARVLDGREGDARSCAWSPDGHWLVSISSGFSSDTRNVVRLWNARTWQPGPAFDHGANGPNWIHDCVLPPSGEWLATYAAGTVWIWDVDSGDLREMVEGRLVAAAPDGTWLAIGRPGHVALYRMPDGRLLDTFPWHPGPTARAVTGPAGAWVVTSDDGCLRVRELPEGRVLCEFNVDGRGDQRFVLAPDGSWLAAEIGPRQSRTRVWDTTTGEVRATYEFPLGPVHTIAPDGSWIVATLEETRTMLLDVTGNSSTPIPLGEHSSTVTSYAVSPDGACLAAGCQDGTIWLWDLHGGAAEQRPDPRRVPSSSCAAAPDGSWLATTDDTRHHEGGVAIWDVATGRRSRVCGAGSGPHHSCVAAPDGTWLATARSDAVLIWDVATGRLRHHIDCPVRPGHVLISAAANYVIDLAVASDGTWLAAACEDGTVRLLDVATGQTRAILDHPAITGRMLSCVVAPDASRLAYSGLDATIVHDLPGGTNREIDSSGRLFDVSPDGSLIAGEQGFDIRIWSATTGETLHVLRGHTHFVTTCRWSPDGIRLASAGDHTVRIWAADTGEIETTVRFYADPNDSRNPMDCTWLPDGRTLAVTGRQGLHLFDLANTPSDLIAPVPHR
ncbi:WD40 repeat domain-containing protein [Actinomadura sp. B10D3]|uniref:WD40 repeat domain-containing protein n=1 Tax=Actinomadura sp. B10D3 TaxID=3153557 RepID=UPI00325C3BF3